MFKAWSAFGLGLVFVTGCAPEANVRRSEGVLRVAIQAEPQTWNQLLAADRTTHAIADQLHDPLLRLNPETQEIEPALAESWEFTERGHRLVVRLRKGVRFSDGKPLRAEDVAFTFRALYDPSVGSPLLETAQIDGKNFSVEAIDEGTVAFTLPRRTAAVERVFDSIPILPAHLLSESLTRGSLPADTGLGAPPSTIVGLGPFRLKEHVPGERVVLERNPHYWRRDPEGNPLPRLSRMVFDVLSDENARVLRFRSGQIDLLEILTPDAFESLLAQNDGEFELLDLGPGLLTERLWFNLNPEAPIEERKKKWFDDVRFRRAISAAVDRRAMARVVLSGRATPASGPVSVANFVWRDESLGEIAHDLDQARALLSEAGFRWDHEKRLVDREGSLVSFTILTNSESAHRPRMGAFVQEDLAKLGIDAKTAPIQGASLLSRVTGSFDYEAALLGITQTDPDPSAEMALWLSRGPLHFWHPRQKTPFTPWEERIDELMERQLSELTLPERRKLYFEVQRTVVEWLPVIDLVVPHALLGAHRRVLHLRPTPLSHVLWNGEELDVGAFAERISFAVRDASH